MTFSCVIQKIFNDLKISEGIPIFGNKLTNLRFADDVVIIEDSAENYKNSMWLLAKRVLKLTKIKHS